MCCLLLFFRVVDNMRCRRNDCFRNRLVGVFSELFSKKMRKSVVSFMVSVVIVFLLITCCKIWFLDIDVVRGSSMEPTFENNDVLLVRKYNLDIVSKNDVVVVSWIYGLNQNLVKRIVAVPGDHIKIDENGLFINGVFTAIVSDDSDYFKMNRVLSENEYYLLGDNLDDSVDSRIFGPCIFMQVRGIVIQKLL